MAKTTIIPDSVFDAPARSRILSVFQNTDIMLAVAMMVVLVVMIIPLPPLALDILITTNIALSIVVLMVAIYLVNPLDISVFPGLLLVLTLFRLSLNVASTRLILGEGFAGDVIYSFGNFVVKGNYVVGFIIFIILIIIQFVVIVKGAGRIAEVAARFTLDAMPGKQMSIDADLNAGLITEAEARKRREQISREAEFYGAMDGASKFVRGDAIAGLVIVGVNIIGGFIIGILQKNMDFSTAIRTYTLLTVGDGLVTQIPALIVSTSAGLVITRSSSGDDLNVELKNQLLKNSKALYITSGALFLFSIVPGMPTLSFMFLSLVFAGLGYLASRKSLEEEEIKKEEIETKPREVEEPLENYLQVDPLELEIGYGLISLVDEEQGGDLFSRIGNIRKQIALELGFIVPPIRIRDNLQLEPNNYIIKIRGNTIAKGELMMDRLLAINPGTVTEEVEGITTLDPAFNLPSVWITSDLRERAEYVGYTVVEPISVLITHLSEVIKANADKLIGKQETKNMIENLKKEYSAVVDDIDYNVLPLSTIQKVLQNLLKELIPIKDLVTIIEALTDYSKVTKNVDVLTEYVRHSLSETLGSLYADENKTIHAIAIDPKIEQMITNVLQSQNQTTPTLGLPPEVLKKIFDSLSKCIDNSKALGYRPIIITAATIRLYFYRMIMNTFPNVAVLSFTELPSYIEIEFIDKISLENEN